jgi:hypothetical protein
MHCCVRTNTLKIQTRPPEGGRYKVKSRGKTQKTDALLHRGCIAANKLKAQIPPPEGGRYKIKTRSKPKD